jgi:hypothetical protein
LWERTARTEILEQSTSAPRILSADVADAIEALVGPPERRSLPVAFDKDAIVQKLVEIAHTDEDGIVHEQTAIAARSMTETSNTQGRMPMTRRSARSRTVNGSFASRHLLRRSYARSSNVVR